MAFILPFALLAVGLVLWGASRVVYNLCFSPLARFPGPKLAAATLLYEFYFNVIQGGMYIWEIERMHEKYGPIVRINPYELHIKDPEFYDKLYAGGAVKRERYPWFTRGGASPHSIFATVGNDLHRLRRSALNTFFSKRSIIDVEPLINEELEKVCKWLSEQERTEEPLDLRVLFDAFALDTVSHYCFGESWGCLEDPLLALRWKIALDTAFEKTALAMHCWWLLEMMGRIPIWLVETSIQILIRTRMSIQNQVEAILRYEKASSEKSRHTIFHELRDSDLPPHEKSVQRLTDEGYILIVAGGDTTSMTLCMIAFYLLKNPEMLQTLMAELKSVMPDAKTLMGWNQLEKLPYLTALVSEGLRMATPVTTRLPRISPNEVIRYGGWEIPPGIPVSMSYYFVHRDPTIFSNPDTFDPERWIQAHNEGFRLEKYLVPFCKGSRMCLGMNLAYAEVYMAIATVFRRYKLELYETTRADVDIARDLFMARPQADSKGVRIVVVSENE